MGEDATTSWDIALAGLAEAEYRNLGRALMVADFSRLAKDNATRLDDIMETVFELCLQGKWRYQDARGETRVFTKETVKKLCADGRVSEEDLAHYTGGWSPVSA